MERKTGELLAMSDGQGVILIAPATTDGMDITGADAATLNLDIHIVVTEWLRLKLVLVELGPRFPPEDLEAGELIRIRHDGITATVETSDDEKGKKDADAPVDRPKLPRSEPQFCSESPVGGRSRVANVGPV